MALIKCPECGASISDKSQTCVKCGCPIQAVAQAKAKEQAQTLMRQKKASVISIRVIIFFVLFAIGLACEFFTFNGFLMGICSFFVFWGIISLIWSILTTTAPMDFSRASIPRAVFAFSIGVAIGFVLKIIYW